MFPPVEAGYLWPEIGQQFMDASDSGQQGDGHSWLGPLISDSQPAGLRQDIR